jgi:hypothetical protein
MDRASQAELDRSSSGVRNQANAGPGGRYTWDVGKTIGLNINPGQGKCHGMTGVDGCKMPAPMWCPVGLTKT